MSLRPPGSPSWGWCWEGCDCGLSTDFEFEAVPFLREHIRKENETLLPLARSLFSEAEQEQFAKQWRSFSG